MKTLAPVAAIDALEDATWLDPVVEFEHRLSRAIFKPQWLRDLLHGVPQGHPLHPPLVQVPLGAWFSAAFLDLVPGSEEASRRLVGAGVVAAVPAIAAGYTDYGDLHEQQMRVGLVHAAANLTAVGLYSVSWLARRSGRHGLGKTLSFAGLSVAGVGGFLGGHLSFRQAAGANHVEDVPHRVAPGWHSLGPVDELPTGTLTRRTVGDVPVTVLRQESSDAVFVIADLCSHLSGPLHEGELTTGAPGEGPCVTCPWHGSTFSLRDGAVVNGPATAPQPSFATRVVDGRLEVSLPGAG
ncbi:hypothetical protein GCM10011512_18250 [Tersicoccus solisilvae]|uniref:Rieske domain-containing protein n=1 Tax=Tersicoccus solisilvae TaxID=1882339 RepID=A0ABQ1P627_9MICC|nr:Rieske (2Fe-2S) protein [Tersicoccus solisilvae]GGC91508.1 hypothetical protein GCM10011512_18250 [Tersicoccus solisilvae]